MNGRCVRMIPMFIIMGIIFFLSHQPGDSLNLPSFTGADKVAHFCAYATLGLTVLFAHAGETRIRRPLSVSFTVLAVGILYGLSDEFHQSFIPSRSVSFLDLVADTSGGLFVGAIFYYRTWKKRLKG